MSQDGCSLGGACLTRLLALEKIPVEPLKATPHNSRLAA